MGTYAYYLLIRNPKNWSDFCKSFTKICWEGGFSDIVWKTESMTNFKNILEHPKVTEFKGPVLNHTVWILINRVSFSK